MSQRVASNLARLISYQLAAGRTGLGLAASAVENYAHSDVVIDADSAYYVVGAHFESAQPAVVARIVVAFDVASA